MVCTYIDICGVDVVTWHIDKHHSPIINCKRDKTVDKSLTHNNSMARHHYPDRIKRANNFSIPMKVIRELYLHGTTSMTLFLDRFSLVVASVLLSI